MPRERWHALPPPPDGLGRLRRSLHRRSRRTRRRRRRLTAGLSGLVVLAVVGRALLPSPQAPIAPPRAAPYDTALHPALAVAEHAPLATVSLLGQAGTLTEVPTSRDDVILVLHELP